MSSIEVSKVEVVSIVGEVFTVEAFSRRDGCAVTVIVTGETAEIVAVREFDTVEPNAAVVAVRIAQWLLGIVHDVPFMAECIAAIAPRIATEGEVVSRS